MRRFSLLLPFLLAGCATLGGRGRAASETRALRGSIDSLLAAPKFSGAMWGVLVIDAERGDTLYSRNAGKLFIPASNQKILTAAVALHRMGPEFRYSTTVSANAPPVAGVMDGDLIILGTGDPSVSDRMRTDAMRPLREIADSLAARGILRITGRLANGFDAFPDATLGFGWSWDDLDAPFSAGVDELYFNEGFTRIVVRGGERVGDSAQIRTTPAKSYPRIVNRAVTAPRQGTPPRNRVSLLQDSSDVGSVIVVGTVAPGDSVVQSITFRDPAAAYLAALREALAERGIAVEGGIASRPLDRPPVPSPVPTATEPTPLPTPPSSGQPLFSVLSPPLREILPAFMKPSQNQIGEILLKTLGGGRADSGARIVGQVLAAWGARPDGAVIRDGSGLSRHDVVTPETIVKVLVAMRRDSAFTAFYDALPIAGVDGTISNRMRGTPAEGNLRAKTGSLDMVRSLSGYVTTADRRQLIFSILANHWTVPAGDVTATADSIGVRLARLGARR
jgi:D-alanyl-D-alanine carboxypeptidase/D-alanyl-D-alanine-endopeptidase (penicillin-binding protein 4)